LFLTNCDRCGLTKTTTVRYDHCRHVVQEQDPLQSNTGA
jgi:hypothetical protein